MTSVAGDFTILIVSPQQAGLLIADVSATVSALHLPPHGKSCRTSQRANAADPNSSPA
jgi:hypothetical protein